MTKKELEKEAEEWVISNTEIYDDKFGIEYETEPRAKEAYIAGAEPREKRIEELELKIKHLTKHLEPQAMTSLFEQVEEEVMQEQRIEELEKENAELKEQNIKDCKNFNKTMKETKVQWKKEHYQLTKAKEIIKELLDTQNRLDPYRNIFKDRIMKAEQFLNEVSK